MQHWKASVKGLDGKAAAPADGESCLAPLHNIVSFKAAKRQQVRVWAVRPADGHQGLMQSSPWPVLRSAAAAARRRPAGGGTATAAKETPPSVSGKGAAGPPPRARAAAGAKAAAKATAEGKPTPRAPGELLKAPNLCNVAAALRRFSCSGAFLMNGWRPTHTPHHTSLRQAALLAMNSTAFWHLMRTALEVAGSAAGTPTPPPLGPQRGAAAQLTRAVEPLLPDLASTGARPPARPPAPHRRFRRPLPCMMAPSA